MYSEKQIIDGCIKKDPVYQRILYDNYVNEMTSICLRYTKNEADAKDVLQEGFIKVFEHIKSFKGKSSLQHWVRRIIINTAIKHIKKEFTKSKLKEEYNPQIHDSLDEHNLEDLTRDKNAEEIIEKIQWLPLGYRSVLNLYAIEGFSHKEIAKTLNISVGTSKSQLSKARKMLISFLQTKEEKILNDK